MSQESPSQEKTLPPGADGDDSVVIDNGAYRIDVGETESGTWIWEHDGHSTLYHEFFALGVGNQTVASYNPESIEQYFPDEVEPGEKASAVVRYTLDGVPLLVKRTVRMDPSDPTFTMKYDVANAGEESISPWIAQYADFDDGSNDYTDDVGEYTLSDPPESATTAPSYEYVFVRDEAEDAFAGFSARQRSDAHLVDDYPGTSEVLNNNFDNDDRYPASGSGDAVVAMKWELAELAPGESDTLTIQWGARNDRQELTADLDNPEFVETTPPIARQTATATTFSFIPGRNENSSTGGNKDWSGLPNGKVGTPPRDFKLDSTFIGDQLVDPPETVSEYAEMAKTEDGLDVDLNQWRLKHDVAVQFEVGSDGKTIPSDQTVGVWVDETDGGEITLHREDDDSPDYRLDTFVPGGSEPPYTVVEEGVINKQLHPVGRHFGSRKLRASSTDRWVAAEKRQYVKDGERIDGIRVSTIHGHSDPYAEKLSEGLLADGADAAGLVPTVPKVYTWIELTVLADGTTLLRVPDASVFPKHAAYLDGASGGAEYEAGGDTGSAFSETPQSGDLVDQTDIEVLTDTDATSADDTYSVAINETTNNVFDRFNEEAQGNDATPFNTPFSQYLHGYQRNWDLVEHPMLLGGTDENGDDLSRDEVLEVLTSTHAGTKPLSPFPVGYQG